MSRLDPQDLRALMAAIISTDANSYTGEQWVPQVVLHTDRLLAELEGTAPAPDATLALSEAVREATMAQLDTERLREHLKRADETVERMAKSIMEQAAEVRRLDAGWAAASKTILRMETMVSSRHSPDEVALAVNNERERIADLISRRWTPLWFNTATPGSIREALGCNDEV